MGARSGRALRLRALGTASAVLLALLVAAAPAHAFSIRQNVAAKRPHGQLILSPSNLDVNVKPGVTTHTKGFLINSTNQELDVKLSVMDLAASPDPTSFVDPVPSSRYGASSWVHPERSQITLPAGAEASFDIAITPPANASAGSSYAALQASTVASKSGEIIPKATLNGELFMNAPGNVVKAGFISKATLDQRFVLGGDGFVTYDVGWKNTGTVTTHVSGTIKITSLFGNTVTTIPIKDYRVLRNSERVRTFEWLNMPSFGLFHAKLTLQANGKTYTRGLPSLLILPPWWVFVIIALLIVFPLALRWYRRRNDWKQYLDDDFDDWDDPTLSIS